MDKYTLLMNLDLKTVLTKGRMVSAAKFLSAAINDNPEIAEPAMTNIANIYANYPDDRIDGKVMSGAITYLCAFVLLMECWSQDRGTVQ